MFRFRLSRMVLTAGGVCALLLGAATVQAQQYDDAQSYDQSQQNVDTTAQAPGRVARLAYLSGQVQFAPAGESDWGSVEVNRPMVIGDRLLTGDDGRAVLELGDASIRIDNDSAFDFLNLDQDNVQIELSQGTLNLAVRQLDQGGNFEVDTPTVAFVASAPGIYRIDDDPSGTGSMVTVFRGAGTVYGENGVSRQVAEGTSYRFNDSTLSSVDATGLPSPDDFDRFCEARDANYQRYAQQQEQYVPPDMIGGDDLYQYGQWNTVPEYGNVWYPTSVPVGWAPYRYGHWAWIDPWGWTWVGDEPWGFAPFHYGRWVYVSNRWGWIPGPARVRPVYAPALVAFVGGSGLSISVGIGGGGPVGWFPLGPRDVYVPWFPASRNYFTNVNVTNIRNVYVNKTVINNFYSDYRAGRMPPRNGHDYAYRQMPGAVTAVPRNVFTDARPVHPAVLKLNRTQLERSEVALRPAVNPGKASIGLRQPTPRPALIKGREPFARPVVARHQPPPRPVGFAAREKVIAQQHGQPLTPAQMQELRKTHPAATPQAERVKLVPAVATRHGAASGRPAEPAARNQPSRAVAAPRPTEPSARQTAPTPARNQPAQPARPGELPSARFAHPGERGTLPRAPVIRPAGEPQRNAPEPGRLPVVQPVQRSPQPAANRAVQQQREQQQRQLQEQTQQRARDQQMQQQREAQVQIQQREQAAQQRIRQQQMQQQHDAQLQAQQRERAQAAQEERVRQQQMQQQREAQVQAQQREQAIQQQRSMQMQQQQRAIEMQRQQREVQRAPQRYTPPPSNRQAPEHREPPPRKHPPPPSSGG